MKNKLTSVLCIVSLIMLILFNITPTYAITLSVIPDSQETALGSRVEINIVVSDIPYDRAIYDYGWSLYFDSSVLSLYHGILYDPMATDGLNPNAHYQVCRGNFPLPFPDSNSRINFGGYFAGYTNFELLEFQPHTFTLATFFFDTLSPETTYLHLYSGMAEEFEGPYWDMYPWHEYPPGGCFTFGYVPLQDGHVHIVPEPTTMLLIGFGLLGIASLRRKK